MTSDAEEAREAAHAAVAEAAGNVAMLRLGAEAARSAGHLDAANVYYGAILKLLEDIPRGSPKFTAARFQMGDLLVQMGRIDDARAPLTEAADDPIDPRPPLLLGRIARACGDLAQAATWCEAALARQPGFIAAMIELSDVRLQQGQFPAAIGLLQRVSAAKPNAADISYHLAVARFRSGDADNAMAELERAAALSPEDRNIQQLMFKGCLLTGRRAQALAVGRRLIAQGLQDPMVLREMLNLAEDAAEEGRIRSQLHVVCASGKGDARSWRELARAAMREGDYDRCMEIFDEGIAQTDSGALRLAQALTLPQIPRSMEQIADLRGGMERRLDALIEGGYQVADPLADVRLTTFYLAYHGLNDLGLQKKSAAAHLAVAPHLAWTAPHCAHPRSPGAKIRLGIASRHLRVHAVGGLLAGIIRSLDQAKFDIILIHVGDARDALTEALDSAVAHAVTLPPTLAEARTKVAALELDILFYADIGMDPFTYYLAFARLARVQAVWPGHPVTTGIPTIDAFISSAAMEPEDAPSHYSERLIRLPHLPIFGRPIRDTQATAVNLPLPEGRRLYVAPNSLYKFHPEFDRLIVRIMREDPLGTLVMIGEKDTWYNMLYKRLYREIPDGARRIVILSFLNTPMFTALLRSAGAILDSIHFSGGNTSLEGIAAGVAPVTLEGRFMRGRTTTGMYRQMGLGEFVTTSADAYVERALRMAQDPDFRAETGAAVHARAHLIFEQRAVIKHLEDCFVDLVSEARW